MSRPTRPQNYATFWHELVGQLAKQTSDLVFEVDTKVQAINRRVTFHAFRNSLEREAKRAELTNERRAELRDLAMSAGTWTVLVRSKSVPSMRYEDIPKYGHTVNLIFRHRDKQEESITMLSQLKAQTGQTTDNIEKELEKQEDMDDAVKSFLDGDTS